jgi:2'-5' RNA ligase
MIHVPVENWNEITSKISSEDLYKESEGDNFGIQKNPHLTLLYPITKIVDVDEIKSIIRSVVKDEIPVKIQGIDLFENQNYDVVKFNVLPNDILNNLHDELKLRVPNNDRYEVYNPHITLAYAKKGLGQKYVDPNYNYDFKSIDKIIYTRPNDTDLIIEL